eukprot:TRINITY_DN3056_c0_g1_i4.p1 TRINITY_DN3056_c0_g1~~TRINITY_DN3056_c0_g1_i4.p1  ORF type:complete len:258 (-),score=58.57 TRINITY_DN3056_c0_g1_i4:363-1136(-)
MLPPHNSLVRYDNPILVSTTKDKKGKTKKPEARGSHTAPEDILNSILPPREWTDDGKLWVQYVSSTPATRLDVIQLQENLDQRLQHRQARETGICPIREELYAQCFDELIRQVTIQCAERGLLLLRVRDEIRMTIASYQTLYESSIAYGMRKALAAEQSKAVMQNRVRSLQGDCRELERSVAEMEAKIDAFQKREKANREEADRKHREDVEILKSHNTKLREELEAQLSIGGTSGAAAAAAAAPAPAVPAGQAAGKR